MGTRQQWKKVQRMKKRCKKKRHWLEITLFLVILLSVIVIILLLH